MNDPEYFVQVNLTTLENLQRKYFTANQIFCDEYAKWHRTQPKSPIHVHRDRNFVWWKLRYEEFEYKTGGYPPTVKDFLRSNEVFSSTLKYRAFKDMDDNYLENCAALSNWIKAAKRSDGFTPCVFLGPQEIEIVNEIELTVDRLNIE